MKKQFLSLCVLVMMGATLPVFAQSYEDEDIYMNWSYASGVDKPRPQATDTTLQNGVSQGAGGNYTYDNYYSQMQTTTTDMNTQMMGGTQGGMENQMIMGGMQMMGANQMAMGNPQMMGGAPMMAGPVLTQITPAQAQAGASVQYVNTPVKVQYPITKQFPVSVQYPVTVQRDITVNRPVVMQQPVVVQRPVVMQQPVMVQHQPMMVQQQPIYMQQQPTYVQQQPVVVQAGNGGAALQSMPAYSVTGYAIQSSETYPAAYAVSN